MCFSLLTFTILYCKWDTATTTDCEICSIEFIIFSYCPLKLQTAKFAFAWAASADRYELCDSVPKRVSDTLIDMASMRRRDSTSEMTAEPIKETIKEDKVKAPDYSQKMSIIRTQEAAISAENAIAMNAAKVYSISYLIIYYIDIIISLYLLSTVFCP